MNGVRDVAGFQDLLGLFHKIHIEIERRVLDHPQILGMKPSDKMHTDWSLGVRDQHVLDDVYDLASNPGKLASNPGKLCRGR